MLNGGFVNFVISLVIALTLQSSTTGSMILCHFQWTVFKINFYDFNKSPSMILTVILYHKIQVTLLSDARIHFLMTFEGARMNKLDNRYYNWWKTQSQEQALHNYSVKMGHRYTTRHSCIALMFRRVVKRGSYNNQAIFNQWGLHKKIFIRRGIARSYDASLWPRKFIAVRRTNLLTCLFLFRERPVR